MKYNPAFDGIRAAAVIAVALFHANAPFTKGGFLGVDVFFVLSGFLITNIILVELNKTGDFQFFEFYKSRFRRLTPALLLMLITYNIASYFFSETPKVNSINSLLSALYITDYHIAFFGSIGELTHTWSLSIEQQFYIIWPLVLYFSAKRYKEKQLIYFLLFLYLLSIAWRWAWINRGQGWDPIYYRLDTRLSGLILGALLAAAMNNAAIDKILSKNIHHLLIVVLISFAFLNIEWNDFSMLTYGMFFTELATAVIILSSIKKDNLIYKFLAEKYISYLGKLSYGIYLWHYPIFFHLRDSMDWKQVMLYGFPASIACAAISYATIERYFRMLPPTTPHKETSNAV